MSERVEIGNATLYRGDCAEILSSFAARSVHAIVTDPPYQISGKHADENRKNGSVRRHNFDWDIGLEVEALVERVEMAISAMERPGNIIIWCGHGQISAFDRLLTSKGMSTKPLCWVKDCPPPSFGTTRWASGFEMAIFGYDKNSCWNLRQSGMRPNVWNGDALRHGNPDKNGHPTQKPVTLMDWQIDPITKAGDVVLDIFMGSGSTGVSALGLGRKFIGIEKEKEYFDIACKRIEQAQAQLRLFA